MWAFEQEDKATRHESGFYRQAFKDTPPTRINRQVFE
jgi:hypothetical protein